MISEMVSSATCLASLGMPTQKCGYATRSLWMILLAAPMWVVMKAAQTKTVQWCRRTEDARRDAACSVSISEAGVYLETHESRPTRVVLREKPENSFHRPVIFERPHPHKFGRHYAGCIGSRRPAQRHKRTRTHAVARDTPRKKAQSLTQTFQTAWLLSARLNCFSFEGRSWNTYPNNDCVQFAFG